MSEQISLAIEIANEMRDDNNAKAREIINKIEEALDIKQYNKIDSNVIVLVSVRVGNDILSSGGSTSLSTSAGFSEYDLYRFRLNAESMCDEAIEDLKD